MSTRYSTQRYELMAEAFYIMTGHIAPGKDVSPHGYAAPFLERQAAWNRWKEAHSAVINAMMTAFENNERREGR